MHRINPIFIPHGLPETLLEPGDRGERNLNQVQRELEACDKLGTPIRHNIAAVLKFAVDIENHFSRIVSAYLICVDNERQQFLDSALIRASWCTFSIKSEIALEVLSKTDLRKIDCTQDPSSLPIEERDNPVTKADIKNLRKQIKELGRWRNALAHGLITVSEDSEHRVFVNYYASAQQQQELDNNFWKHLEGLMNDIADFIVPARMRLEIYAKSIRVRSSAPENSRN
jgi:hypothetical protein